MAVAKPVRLFGALSIGLFIFLVFTLLRQPQSLHPPVGQNGETIPHMREDPLLDRMLFVLLLPYR
jgi:hypothetical protein